MFGRDDVRLVLGMVEGGVDHARGDPLGNERTQRRFARATAQAYPVVVLDSPIFGIGRVDLQSVLRVPGGVGGAAGLRADIIVAEDASRGEQQDRKSTRLNSSH